MNFPGAETAANNAIRSDKSKIAVEKNKSSDFARLATANCLGTVQITQAACRVEAFNLKMCPDACVYSHTTKIKTNVDYGIS